MPESKPHEQPTNPKRRSLWRSWSLRTLFAFVAICALATAWASYQLRLGQLHKEVAENLRQLGAMAGETRAEKVYLGPIAISITDKRQAWLKALGVEDATTRTGRVVLYERSKGERLEKTIDELSRLDWFKHLSLYGCPMDQAQLARLLESTNVDTLYLEGMKVDRRGIPCLRDTKVKWLLLARTQFSDPGIDDLPISLEYLDATRTRISDEGLDKFVRLTNLKVLILRRTPATEEGIERLREKMPQCRIAWEPLKQP